MCSGREPLCARKYHIEPDDIYRAHQPDAPARRARLRRRRMIMPAAIPNDDKFLEAAVTGKVDCLVSGDADLLELTPYEGIPILRPAEFLARL